VKIVGEGTIDLSTIVPEQRVDIIDTTPPPKIRREVPSPRKPGTNYFGFFAGSISRPENVGCSTLLPDETFGAFGFTLPSKAVVNYVSVRALGVSQPGKYLHVGLFDTNGNKVCAAVIDASRPGMVTGEFADTVNLSPGDYYLAWASEAKIEVPSFGTGADQLALMNAGGGVVVAGVGRCDGDNALPDKLGALTPRTSSRISRRKNPRRNYSARAAKFS
jgi:hypothetical protein